MGIQILVVLQSQKERIAHEDVVDLDALIRGDRAAFTVLVRRHHRALMVVARGMVGSDDAEEVVQSAWVKVFLSIATFEQRSKLLTWLTSIVMNEARMYLRRASRQFEFSRSDSIDLLTGRFAQDGGWQEAPHAWRLPGPEEIMRQEQFGACLAKILEKLPAQQRLVLELRDIMELSLETISAELGLSAGNVRVLLHRARARLYQAIEKFEVSGQC